MANKQSKIVYTDNDRAIVNALRNSEGMTLSQLCDATGLVIKAGHIVSAIKKNLIAKTGEVEAERPTMRKVGTYIYVDSDVHTVDNGKAYNYTDGEREVLAAASSINSPFTLAQLATAMGREKLSSGSINGLVKKGNITKGDQVEIPSVSKTSVGVYSFVNDIPADAE